jgi:hypothetical protein
MKVQIATCLTLSPAFISFVFVCTSIFRGKKNMQHPSRALFPGTSMLVYPPLFVKVVVL